MIRKDRIIKHVNSMDVAFDVLAVYPTSKGIKVKGRWMNQGFVSSYYLFDKTHNIHIPKEELHNIMYCENPYDNECLRKCNWKLITHVK